MKNFLDSYPPSINFLLRKDEKEWRNQNPLRSRLRYRWYEKEIYTAGEHPLQYGLALTFLLIVTVIGGLLLPEEWFSGYWKMWAASEQLTYFTSLWSVQTTIAALVFPFVISFVALLLQRRPSTKVVLQVYLLDSAAVVAGLSSLFLVLTMGVQFLLLATYTLKTVVAWAALDSVWFAFNTVLTIWFIYRTVEFLRTDFEFDVIKKYAVNIALPREFANLFRFQYLAMAQDRNWLQGPKHFDDSAAGKPQILIHPYGRSEGEAFVEKDLHEESRLVNVRFWLLRIVISSWLKKANKIHPKPTTSSRARPKSELLIFPAMAGGVSQGVISLCRTQGDTKLGLISRGLIHLSFSFSPKRVERRHIPPVDLLSENEDEARVAVGSGNIPAFEQAYKKITNLHIVLIGATNIKNEDDKPWSYALLPDVFSFTDRPAHTLWANSYRSLFDAAVRILPDESRPIQHLCYVVSHLFHSEELAVAPVKIKEHLLRLPPLLMFNLGNWWVRTAEEQGFQEHGHFSSVLLKPPYQGVYENVLRGFIGGWESAKDAINPKTGNRKLCGWEDIQEMTDLFTRHIEETAIMLLSAVMRGDQAAAEWMADSISKWWSHSYLEQHEPFYLLDKTEFLTIDLATKSWEEVIPLLDIDHAMLGKDALDKPDDIQRAIFSAAIKNYRKDIWLLVVQVLITWSTKQAGPSSLALLLVEGMLKGKVWRGGGESYDTIGNLSAADLLTILVRQQTSETYRQGYANRLDQFAESASELSKSAWVSGRIYSSVGANDVRSLQDAQLILFIVLSKRDWNSQQRLLRQLSAWVSSAYPCTESAKRTVEMWLARLAPAGGFEYTNLIADIIQRVDNMHTPEEGRARTIASLQGLLDQINEMQNKKIISEPVSEIRLKELETAASATGFVAKTGKFPLGLFKSVHSSTEELKPFTLIRNKTLKGELTAVEMAQRASNESEWLGSTIADHVGALILSDVLSECQVTKVTAQSASEYWVLLKQEAAQYVKQGLTPILILNNPTQPGWVWDWQYPTSESKYQRPEDMEVRREPNGRGDGYLADFNNIEVFTGFIPFGSSVLLARETFKDLAFTQSSEGSFVKAQAVEVKGDETLVDLHLTYCRKIQVEYPRALEIQYTNGSS